MNHIAPTIVFELRLPSIKPFELKSSASKGCGVTSQKKHIHMDSLHCFEGNTVKHCYVCCMWKSELTLCVGACN